MTKIILSILLLIYANGYLQQDTCKCKKPIAKPVPEESDERRIEDYIYKELYGQITALGDSTFPIENILVEVYGHPEVALDPSINSSRSSR